MARAVVVLAVIAGAALLAQQTPPVFRAGVNLTQLDVSVVDANGRTVHGLTAEEFTLFEDGTPQTVEVVSEVNVPDAERGPAWMRDVTPDVRTNSAEDGRLIMFLLDDAQVPTGAEAGVFRRTVLRVAGEIVDRLGPTDLAAVLFTVQNKRDAQDFTNDHRLLHAALDKFKPKQFSFDLSDTHERAGYDWGKVSGGVAESAVKYLLETTGRRKGLIYVTPSFPTDPETLDAMQRAKVTVYQINPIGLKALGHLDTIDLTHDGTAGADPARLGEGKPGATGGFVISSPDQLAFGLERLLQDTGSYYLLGYRSTNPVDTNHKHSIEVRTTRPGATVRTRRDYINPKPPKPSTAPPMAQAVSGILPKTDLPLRLTAAAFRRTGTSKADVAIVLGMDDPALTTRALDHIDVQLWAFTQHGKERARAVEHQDVVASPGRDSAQAEILSHIQLDPGRYELRVSAHSVLVDEYGSAFIDLEVPQFDKAPVSLSGVLLSAGAAPNAAPAGALESIAPVVPTTMRMFRRFDRVTAFLRVYEGGGKPVAPVSLSVEVRDASDRDAVHRRETLDPARFGTTRSADVRLDLPLRDLAPGPHLLRIEATLGATTARREIRFSVR